jgi:hypothetical protein
MSDKKKVGAILATAAATLVAMFYTVLAQAPAVPSVPTPVAPSFRITNLLLPKA